MRGDERGLRGAGWAAAMLAALSGCAATGDGRPDAASPPPEVAIQRAPRASPRSSRDPTPRKEATQASPRPLAKEPALVESKPAEAPTLPAPPETGPRAAALPSGFHNPMPGGVMAGYQGDTGLDIAGSPRPVYAIAAGTIEYAEPGHTLWTGPSDTANCVRFALDAPIPWKGRRITHVYYAHLSQLAFLQREGEAPRRHVEAGERLGVSGVANHSPHLHLGLLLDGDVSQAWGTFLLADAVRKVLGGYRNGAVLPRQAPGALPGRTGQPETMRSD